MRIVLIVVSHFKVNEFEIFFQVNFSHGIKFDN